MQVTLIDWMGSDITVAQSARVSFDKKTTPNGHQSVVVNLDGEFVKKNIPIACDRDSRLILRLARDGHWTPFSHPQITLRETVPIFVARQRMRSQVGFTINEISRRYVDDPPQFYFPDEWRQRPEKGIKQGSGGEHVNSRAWTAVAEKLADDALTAYQTMIRDGVAPEQARMILPQSMFTSYFVTGSLAAFARAYRLRIDSHAQKEIQALAQQWDAIIRPLFPISWGALIGGEQ